MRGLLLAAAAAALAGCSPFEGVERDRAADLAAIATHPPAERAPELRDRLLRDALNGRIRSVKGWEAVQDPVVASLASRLPLTLAEDYVALGDALAGAGDRDGALAAYEDARVVTARAGRDPGYARVRQAALRGEAATWKALGQEERGRAATLLADAEALHPAPADWAAFLVGSVARADSPGLRRLGAAPVIVGAGPLEVFVTTEIGGRAAALVAEGLELMRAGAPARQMESISARLAALAPPPPAPPPPAPPPAPSAIEPPPPAAAPPVAVGPAAPAPAGKGDAAARLKKLDDLRSQKLISDAEYMRERARILKESL